MVYNHSFSVYIHEMPIWNSTSTRMNTIRNGFLDKNCKLNLHINVVAKADLFSIRQKLIIVIFFSWQNANTLHSPQVYCNTFQSKNLFLKMSCIGTSKFRFHITKPNRNYFYDVTSYVHEELLVFLWELLWNVGITLNYRNYMQIWRNYGSKGNYWPLICPLSTLQVGR